MLSDLEANKDQIEIQTVFSTEWFTVEQLTSTGVKALAKPYYRLNAPDGVLVLALTADSRIILVRQYRPALGRHTLEIPAGAVDPGEAPVEAAKRELLEETGYSCSTWHSLGEGDLMASRLNSHQFSFLGVDARLQSSYLPQEDIEVHLVTPTELRDLALSGVFRQFAAFAPLVLAGWKLGESLVDPGKQVTKS